MLFYTFCLVFSVTSYAYGVDELRFATIFSDGMVLQRQGATVWGYATPGVSVSGWVLKDDKTVAEFSTLSTTEGIWTGVFLGDELTGVGFRVEVSSADQPGELVLSDVAFGEVWFCSGQSNMHWPVKAVRNAAQEIETAILYENIRLLGVQRNYSTVPIDEPLELTTTWTKPESEFLLGASFSALCLFVGEQLYDELNVPIGLIDSSYGGTHIEAWSPPEALTSCNITNTAQGANHNEYLFNAMVNPFLRMTIRGVLWYQGENNAGYPGSNYAGHNRDLYDCTFSQLINTWGKLWEHGTQGLTSAAFPFGFVQLAPFTDQRDNFAWPILRWKQTFGYGYVPNEAMPNVFMAAAMDDDIDLHPKNKRLPATRLAWAASNMVYSLNRPLSGPKFSEAYGMDLVDVPGDVVVVFDEPVYVGRKDGNTKSNRFMVCCLESMDACDNVEYGVGWQSVDIVEQYADQKVLLDTSFACEGGQYSGLAYLWLETPCHGEEQCPIYSVGEGIYEVPVAPFRTSFARPN